MHTLPVGVINTNEYIIIRNNNHRHAHSHRWDDKRDSTACALLGEFALMEAEELTVALASFSFETIAL